MANTALALGFSDWWAYKFGVKTPSRTTGGLAWTRHRDGLQFGTTLRWRRLNKKAAKAVRRRFRGRPEICTEPGDAASITAWAPSPSARRTSSCGTTIR